MKTTFLQCTISITGLLVPLYCVCSELYLGDNGIVRASGADDVSKGSRSLPGATAVSALEEKKGLWGSNVTGLQK